MTKKKNNILYFIFGVVSFLFFIFGMTYSSKSIIWFILGLFGFILFLFSIFKIVIK